MKSIVFATNNLHKLSELRQKLKNKYDIIGLNEIGFSGEIPETGKTLFENASIKSNFIYQTYKIDCFSDDTGLLIAALNNRPGVYSARYAGEEANPDRNIEKVLYELKNVSDRTACFKTVFSLIMDGKEYFFEGEISGHIAFERKGMNGFGYDPVFIPTGYFQTFAEMDLVTKNQISHRAMATNELVKFLETQM